MNKGKKEAMEKKDIFDGLMSLPVLNIFEPFYKKHKEALLYLFFGFCSLVINIIGYWLFSEMLKLSTTISNAGAWILSTTFAYATNRKWVFSETASGLKEISLEATKFFAGRIATLIIEGVLLYVFIDLLNYPNMIIKVLVSVVVIVLNYVFSKFWIFVNKKS